MNQYSPNTGRHLSVEGALKRLDSDFTPPTEEQAQAGQDIRELYADLANELALRLSDSPELTTALNLLWDSKNYAVYLALTQ